MATVDYGDQVRAGIKAINPSIVETAQLLGWPVVLDAVSTILVSLLIAAVGGDEARAVCGRMYQEVARLEAVWAPVLGTEPDLSGETQGRA